MNSPEPKFDWIPIYKELASALLRYKNNRQDFITILSEIFEALKMKNPFLDPGDKTYDVCPFTVFASFNRGLTDSNRINIIREFKEKLGLTSPLPTSFDGIPLMNNRSMWFYRYADKRKETDIQNLWDFFDAALSYADSPSSATHDNFVKWFNIVGKQDFVKWNLTMGLFWIRPYNYVNLDKTNRNLINKKNILSEELKSLPSGEQYVKIIEECRNYLNNSSSIVRTFSDFSYAAYMSGEPVADKLKVKLCWYVGAYPGGVDKSDEFIESGIWVNGYDDKFIDQVNSIQVNDKIAIKAAYTKTKNLPFDAGDNTVSVMAIKAIGTVKKNYGDGKRLDVDWEKFDEPKIWYFFTNRMTVWKVENKPDDWMYQALLDFTFENQSQDYNRFLSHPYWGGRYGYPEEIDFPEIGELKIEYNPYNEADFLREVYISKEKYHALRNLLFRKKNIILTGPPGVGKTFSAKRLAYSIIGSKAEQYIKTIQFHQNYSYEDFIQGYRPTDDGFKLINGPFYEFCIKADRDPENDYFFIIDEINRGNLSKIFGELLMLIEADKRGHKIKILYSDIPFSVPKNLYLIGMMNTADRSLAMIDYALRRRFSFFEFEPAFDSEGFESLKELHNNEDYNKLISEIKSINEMIRVDSSLGDGCAIGHSFLCPEGKIDEEWLRSVIEYDLIPLIKEYWFDNIENFNDCSQRLQSVLSKR